MSNIHITPTSQWRAVVGTFDEALETAKAMVVNVDPWAGATVGINPVMRDPATQRFMWEVMVSGQPVRTDTSGGPPSPPSP